MSTQPTVVRALDAQPLIEGDEFVRKYFHTERIVFAVSWLQPGQRSLLDPGHAGADEVCYVISGKVALAFPGSDTVVELHAGDAALVPESEAHEVLGLGTEPAMMVWAVAPTLGREDISVGGSR